MTFHIADTMDQVLDWALAPAGRVPAATDNAPDGRTLGATWERRGRKPSSRFSGWRSSACATHEPRSRCHPRTDRHEPHRRNKGPVGFPLDSVDCRRLGELGAVVYLE